MLIKDVFFDIIQPKLRNDHDNWDNLAEDIFFFDPMSRQFDENETRHRKEDKDHNEAETQAHLSFDHCRAACESRKECVQFRFGNGICSTSTAVRFGQPAEEKKEAYYNYRSGWMVPRINEWAKKHRDCGKIKFPTLDA